MIQDIYSFFHSVQANYGLSVHIRQENDKTVTLVDLDQLGKTLQREESCVEKKVLSSAEKVYFKRFKYLKRRKEWLGGRVAAKAAIHAFSGSAYRDAGQFSILPNEHGRPIAQGTAEGLTEEQINFSISISHSKRYAVALAASENSCGIDLQTISPKLSSLTDHFASDKELALLARQGADQDYDTWLTMLWTVKESLKKSTLHDQSVIFSGTETEQIRAVREHVYLFDCTVQGRPQSAAVYTLFPYILSISQADSPL